MTNERAREIAKIFDDNFAMAKKMGADTTSFALAAATVYTIDDLLAARVTAVCNAIRNVMQLVSTGELLKEGDL